MDTVRNLRKKINYYGYPPVVPQLKDPFAHWHPRHERIMLQKELKDVPVEQIKEMASRIKLLRSACN